jgi:hypothetical protein
MNVNEGSIPLLEMQCRTRDTSVDGHAVNGMSADIDFLLRDREIVFDDCGVDWQYPQKAYKDNASNRYAF